MSQEQPGLEAGVQRNFVSLIELGQNRPTITTISKLADALALTASALVAEAETEIATIKRLDAAKANLGKAAPES